MYTRKIVIEIVGLSIELNWNVNDWMNVVDHAMIDYFQNDF